MLAVVMQTAPGRFILEGAFTFASVSQVERTSTRLFSEVSDAVLDLQGVTEIDSAGLALLIEWIRKAEKKGMKMTFCNLPDSLWAIARASNLEGLIPIAR